MERRLLILVRRSKVKASGGVKLAPGIDQQGNGIPGRR